MMARKYGSIILLLLVSTLKGQVPDTSQMTVRGLCIAAPQPDKVPEFIQFIEDVLVPNKVNTLVLRVNYNYAFSSHPEMQGEHPLTADLAHVISSKCEDNNIELIPLINLLGHQSWHSKVGKLLQVYPEFDETPHISLPETYRWPNDDGLYCKSYCPMHPDVHDVVFDLVDELIAAFNAHAVHTGMDEVFYIGDDQCPRCAGRSKAKLFAGEITKMHNHLHRQGKKLWIWGDRLINGQETGIGMWEASMNQTHDAIDFIPKDVVICDWHYERADPTPAYFAIKGFDVVTCPWNKPDVALNQLKNFRSYQSSAGSTLRNRYLGMMQTVWSSAESFIEKYHDFENLDPLDRGPIECFRRLFTEINAGLKR